MLTPSEMTPKERMAVRALFADNYERAATEGEAVLYEDTPEATARAFKAFEEVASKKAPEGRIFDLVNYYFLVIAELKEMTSEERKQEYRKIMGDKHFMRVVN